MFLTWLLNPSTPALCAQVPGSAPHPNFIFFRYASLTSLSVFGGYGQGKWLAFFGMIQNPRTNYREIGGGIGTSVPLTRHTGGLIAFATANASDGWYAQLYLQSNTRFGRLGAYLSLAYYEPLEAAGSRQIKLNPGLLMWRLLRRLEAGGAYVFLDSEGTRAIHQLGPAVQISVPNGRVSLELLQRLHDVRVDLRVTFQALL